MRLRWIFHLLAMLMVLAGTAFATEGAEQTTAALIPPYPTLSPTISELRWPFQEFRVKENQVEVVVSYSRIGWTLRMNFSNQSVQTPFTSGNLNYFFVPFQGETTTISLEARGPNGESQIEERRLEIRHHILSEPAQVKKKEEEKRVDRAFNEASIAFGAVYANPQENTGIQATTTSNEWILPEVAIQWDFRRTLRHSKFGASLSLEAGYPLSIQGVGLFPNLQAGISFDYWNAFHVGEIQFSPWIGPVLGDFSQIGLNSQQVFDDRITSYAFAELGLSMRRTFANSFIDITPYGGISFLVNSAISGDSAMTNLSGYVLGAQAHYAFSKKYIIGFKEEYMSFSGGVANLSSAATHVTLGWVFN